MGTGRIGFMGNWEAFWMEMIQAYFHQLKVGQ